VNVAALADRRLRSPGSSSPLPAPRANLPHDPVDVVAREPRPLSAAAVSSVGEDSPYGPDNVFHLNQNIEPA
jgi:hypothetical protein